MKKNKEKKTAKSKEVISITDYASEARSVTIDNHLLAAVHHKKAAECHTEAAKHYQSGNDEKAAYYTLLAHGHHAIAGQFISDDAKHHAQTLKETSYHH